MLDDTFGARSSLLRDTWRWWTTSRGCRQIFGCSVSVLLQYCIWTWTIDELLTVNEEKPRLSVIYFIVCWSQSTHGAHSHTQHLINILVVLTQYKLIDRINIVTFRIQPPGTWNIRRQMHIAKSTRVRATSNAAIQCWSNSVIIIDAPANGNVRT